MRNQLERERVCGSCGRNITSQLKSISEKINGIDVAQCIQIVDLNEKIMVAF